jgi:hypothetical protein
MEEIVVKRGEACVIRTSPTGIRLNPLGVCILPEWITGNQPLAPAVEFLAKYLWRNNKERQA